MGKEGKEDIMNGKLMLLIVILLGVVAVNGCVGYFHYHPIKSTEQTKAGEPAEKIFLEEGIGAPVAPVLPAESMQEEILIK
jgi:hypothetical protein